MGKQYACELGDTVTFWPTAREAYSCAKNFLLSHPDEVRPFIVERADGKWWHVQRSPRNGLIHRRQYFGRRSENQAKISQGLRLAWARRKAEANG